jgi:hypothetical protein
VNILLEHFSVHLGAGETISIIDGKGARVAVASGRVWITQEHDPRDVLLSTGQSFELDRDGTAIVEALVDAEVALGQPGPGTSRTRHYDPRLTALAVLGHPRSNPDAHRSLRRAA